MSCEIKQQHENCPSLIDDNDNDNNKLYGGSRRKRENLLVKHELQLPELPSDIWVEIMGKLPIKSLYGFKCVSKAWHSHVSHVLTTQKGIDLPPYGLFFTILHDTSIDDDDDDFHDRNRTFYLAFLSLVGDYKLTKWSLTDFETESAIVTIGDHENTQYDHGSGSGSGWLLGNLTLEFGTMMSVISKVGDGCYWNVHRGLFLGVLDPHTFVVYNPATKESFYLSKPASKGLSARIHHQSFGLSSLNGM
ncbi:putative F-box protein At5g62660 [Chenopodium quinoa]|uniref:putative F-box protein At5g62660 n=1 Tax=Chenopodium quinoa TaxID=63459 RepID=UPI000B78312D|nr:putative F-box protein At5g62660 [Chenopodium quinoa]